MSEDATQYDVQTTRPMVARSIDFDEFAMTPERVRKQVNLIQEVMRGVMTEGEHYGVIPGCKKPSLFKPGAEKLSMTFRFAPAYRITKTDLGGGHREYEVVCTLTHINSGIQVAEGVGSCSTMEGKYRYRGGEKEGTGQPIPKEFWNLKNAGKTLEALALIGGEGFAAGKIDGRWQVCSVGEKVEHDNPADFWNTVLKMAKKRAHVDAVLTATAASDIFTQDIEDMPEVFSAGEPSTTESEPKINQAEVLAEIFGRKLRGGEAAALKTFIGATASANRCTEDKVLSSGRNNPTGFVKSFENWKEKRAIKDPSGGPQTDTLEAGPVSKSADPGWQEPPGQEIDSNPGAGMGEPEIGPPGGDGPPTGTEDESIREDLLGQINDLKMKHPKSYLKTVKGLQIERLSNDEILELIDNINTICETIHQNKTFPKAHAWAKPFGMPK